MSDLSLFSPLKIGNVALPNRIIMAPLTRNRAGFGDAPTEMNARYYAQRAGAGVIISEATQISAEGIGYVHTPGIYTSEQIEGWKKVTDSVHEQDGRIFVQLWHVGRVSHESLQPGGGKPVAPSAIRANAKVFTRNGLETCSKPRALEREEIPHIIDQYAQAVKNAKVAGFDGVEIHAANGYLLDQFMRDGTNHREDEYGGSIENRCRLTLEVVTAAIDEWDAGNIGIRISPTATYNDSHDSSPQETFGYLLTQMNGLDLAYLHVLEPFKQDNDFSSYEESGLLAPKFRKLWRGVYMLNGGYDYRQGQRAIRAGLADAISYGVPFIANPDLVRRFRLDAPLNKADEATFYGGGEKGYTDYPTLDA